MRQIVTLAFLCLLFLTQAQTTYTVGPGQQYTSITAAYAAIPNNFSGPYIISLQSGYSALNENFPIAFTLKSGSSASNTITIRPAVSGILIASADTSGTFEFNGSKYVSIDGRVNGTGNTPDLQVINSNSNGSACMFIPGSSYNSISYVTAQGVSSGIIFNGQYASATGTGNKVSNCNISGLGGAFCNYGVNYLGSQCSWPNTKILYNNIFNFNNCGVRIGGTFDNMVVQGNSLYITQSHVVLDNWSAIAGGGSQLLNFVTVYSQNVQVLGNFIGGNAPRCAGTLFADIRSANFLSIAGASTTPSYIDSNIITHINAYDTVTTTPYGGINIITLSGMCYAGSRAGNQIGDTTSTNALSFTSSNQKTFTLFYLYPGGSVAVENSVIGSISLSGFYHTIYLANSGRSTQGYTALRNNYFGSWQNPSNINYTDPTWPITFYYAYHIDTVSNNTFAGLTLNTTNLTFYGIDSSKAVVNNAIHNLYLENSPNISDFLIQSVTIQGNHISSVHLSKINLFDIFESPIYALNNSVDSFTQHSSASSATIRGVEDPTRSQNITVISGNSFTNFIVLDTSGLTFQAINSYSAKAIDSNVISNIFVPYSYTVTGISFGGLGSTELIGNTVKHINCPGFSGLYINTYGQGGMQQSVYIGNNTISDFASAGYGIYVAYIYNLSLVNNKVMRITTQSGATGIFAGNITSTYCSGNTISGLHGIAGGVGISLTGITMTSEYDTIVNNIIDDLGADASASIGVSVSGLMYSGGNSNITLVHNNALTHLWIGSCKAGSAVSGITESPARSSICYNNLVQIGVKNDGTVPTSDYIRYGIYSTNNTNGLQYYYYYNTVYMVGGAANSSNNSFAFYSGNVNNSIYNNIFVDEVTTPGGSAKNICVVLPGSLNQQIDANIYHAGGANGALASIDGGTTNISTLPAFKTAILGQNLNAMDSDALLVNSTGDTATMNLGPSTGSPAIANGTTFGVPTTIDYYNTARSASAPTIGAIEKAGYQLPVLDSVINVACSSNANGAIIFNMPNGVWKRRSN